MSWSWFETPRDSGRVLMAADCLSECLGCFSGIFGVDWEKSSVRSGTVSMKTKRQLKIWQVGSSGNYTFQICLREVTLSVGGYKTRSFWSTWSPWELRNGLKDPFPENRWLCVSPNLVRPANHGTTLQASIKYLENIVEGFCVRPSFRIPEEPFHTCLLHCLRGTLTLTGYPSGW